jgi:hypothetical protein
MQIQNDSNLIRMSYVNHPFYPISFHLNKSNLSIQIKTVVCCFSVGILVQGPTILIPFTLSITGPSIKATTNGVERMKFEQVLRENCKNDHHQCESMLINEVDGNGHMCVCIYMDNNGWLLILIKLSTMIKVQAVKFF